MSYSASFSPSPSGGLHPTLQLSYSAPPCSCPLYLDLSLPPSFIPDRFQLAQLHQEGRLGALAAAQGEAGASLVVTGSRDLEGPKRGAEGARVVLRLREAGEGTAKQRELVELPLHLRYQDPVGTRWSKDGGQRLDLVDVELQWPTVFWACSEGQEPPSPRPCPSSAIPSLSLPFLSSLHFLSPYNLTHISTSHCPPTLPPPLSLPTPTGVIADLALVESVNFLAIWLGMAWIAWSAFKAWKGGNCKGRKKRE